MGDRSEASRIAALLENARQPYLLGLATEQRGYIAAALGDRERAVELFREAFAQGREYNVYYHWDVPWLRDYPSFLQLLRPKG